MANICNFAMVVTGKEENIKQFIDMMNHRGIVWMGGGADTETEDIVEIGEGKFRYEIIGDTKWSVKSSLIDAAISMRENPDEWTLGKNVDREKLSFVTLFEACKQLKLDMEVYSEEPGCCFQEHYLFVGGDLITEESVEYSEEYNEDTEEFEAVGGFEWEFII